LIPVNLIYFSGRPLESMNVLNWKTAGEIEHKKFIIERAMNGINFEKIGEVPSQAPNGNSQLPLEYTYQDQHLLPGKSYYRLQMVDRNNNTAFSNVIAIVRGAEKLAITDVRPNPVNQQLFFRVTGGKANAIQVILRTAQGQPVLQEMQTIQNNNYLDVSRIPAGIYFLEVIDLLNKEKVIHKVIKE
jgi:hypothetical protein